MRNYLDDQPINLAGSTPRRPLLMALTLCVLALMLFFADSLGFMTPVRGPLEWALRPVAQQLTSWRNGVLTVTTTITSVPQIRAENEALKRRISQLEDELIAREQALAENTRLRQQLGIEEEHPWRLLGAEVAIRFPDAGRRVILIARGHKAGIEPGMAVISQTDSGPTALVGIVEEVGLYMASVLLITDFGSQVSARVLHERETALGILQGQWQRGSRLRLEQVERGITPRVGDTVVSAGLTRELQLSLPLGSVPGGIPIGTVEAVRSDGYALVAELQPFIDSEQLTYVWVILGQKN